MGGVVEAVRGTGVSIPVPGAEGEICVIKLGERHAGIAHGRIIAPARVIAF